MKQPEVVSVVASPGFRLLWLIHGAGPLDPSAAHSRCRVRGPDTLAPAKYWKCIPTHSDSSNRSAAEDRSRRHESSPVLATGSSESAVKVETPPASVAGLATRDASRRIRGHQNEFGYRTTWAVAVSTQPPP